MRNMRVRLGDRRQGKPMPRVPFMDSSGEIIKGNRRKIPAWRMGNIQVNWTDMRT